MWWWCWAAYLPLDANPCSRLWGTVSVKYSLFQNIWVILVRCVMALIHGTNGASPCPHRLIKNQEMADPSVDSQRQTSVITQATIMDAKKKNCAVEHEEILKSADLQDVEVSYWCSHPTYILMVTLRISFGRLEIQIHILHYSLISSIHSLVAYFDTISGLVFRITYRHWAGMLKLESITCMFPVSSSLSNNSCELRAASTPQWRGLNHFSDHINNNFTDGSKWEDMSKVCYCVTICLSACIPHLEFH